ncbi:MAG: hypothetical protein H7062_01035 [Candidatus Saccharimonas sp.]|nr:hypothetical protein [Planctomycetaceae bacterium]
MPCFDSRILDLCQHPHEGVRERALIAASENTHPAIREFALSRLSNGLSDHRIAGLFIKNFQPGDAQLLLDAVVVPEDEDENHGLWMELRKVLEANPQCDDQRLAIVAYALTPCASCRHGAAKLLVERHAAPVWLIAECQHDCEADTQVLSRDAGKHRENSASRDEAT